MMSFPITNQLVNQSITLFDNTDQASSEIQVYQNKNTQLMTLKETQLAEKEIALYELQRENTQATEQVREMIELFKQTLAQKDAEKALLEQQVLGLKSEIVQVTAHKDAIIEEKTKQNEILSSALDKSEKRVEGLKASLSRIETIGKNSLQHWQEFHNINGTWDDKHIIHMHQGCSDSLTTGNALIAEVTKSSAI